MAAIFEEVTIKWKGEEYTVTPTYQMVQHIEQRVSIAGMSSRIANGDPPMSHMAYVVAYLLNKGGCKDASPEDVYSVMLTEMEPEEFGALAAIVMSAFVPQDPKAGNAKAPKEGAASKGGGQTKTA